MGRRPAKQAHLGGRPWWRRQRKLLGTPYRAAVWVQGDAVGQGPGASPTCWDGGEAGCRAFAWDTALVSCPIRGPSPGLPRGIRVLAAGLPLPGVSVVLAVGSPPPPAGQAAHAVLRTGSALFEALLRGSAQGRLTLLHRSADHPCSTCGRESFLAQRYPNRKETIAHGIFTLPGESGSNPQLKRIRRSRSAEGVP